MYDKTTKVMNRATVKADQNFRGFNRYGGSRCARTIPETEFAMISVALTARRISWWILASALALTVVEGAIRKWVIGSAFQVGSYAAYFSKDIVFTLLLLVPACRASSPLLPSPPATLFFRLCCRCRPGERGGRFATPKMRNFKKRKRGTLRTSLACASG